MSDILITVDIYGIIYELEQKLYYKKEKLSFLKNKKDIKKTLKSINKLEFKIFCYNEYLKKCYKITFDY